MLCVTGIKALPLPCSRTIWIYGANQKTAESAEQMDCSPGCSRLKMLPRLVARAPKYSPALYSYTVLSDLGLFALSVI